MDDSRGTNAIDVDAKTLLENEDVIVRWDQRGEDQPTLEEDTGWTTDLGGLEDGSERWAAA